MKKCSWLLILGLIFLLFSCARSPVPKIKIPTLEGGMQNWLSDGRVWLRVKNVNEHYLGLAGVGIKCEFELVNFTEYQQKFPKVEFKCLYRGEHFDSPIFAPVAYAVIYPVGEQGFEVKFGRLVVPEIEPSNNFFTVEPFSGVILGVTFTGLSPYPGELKFKFTPCNYTGEEMGPFTVGVEIARRGNEVIFK